MAGEAIEVKLERRVRFNKPPVAASNLMRSSSSDLPCRTPMVHPRACCVPSALPLPAQARGIREEGQLGRDHQRQARHGWPPPPRPPQLLRGDTPAHSQHHVLRGSHGSRPLTADYLAPPAQRAATIAKRDAIQPMLIRMWNVDASAALS
eukprot:CAMPEP_0182862750 /NCGR_PEP_ID=MMETSP0034_2-20130328/6250_1 /TAXON_ID=156128 /ORGANISM="Nephroselmis pyriformis, Strain CCMP717" /LENGTH=149 /DNA_ID=CAMNT_0024994865 /DNA_START=8 /DNA_END=454 /DNA_ORIENTATION=-